MESSATGFCSRCLGFLRARPPTQAETIVAQQGVRVGEASMGQRVMRVESRRLLEILNAPRESFLRPLTPEVEASQVRFVSLDVSGVVSGRPRPFPAAQIRPQRPDPLFSRSLPCVQRPPVKHQRDCDDDRDPGGVKSAAAAKWAGDEAVLSDCGGRGFDAPLSSASSPDKDRAKVVPKRSPASGIRIFPHGLRDAVAVARHRFDVAVASSPEPSAAADVLQRCSPRRRVRPDSFRSSLL